jgi:predicted transposase YdaD
MFTPKEYSDYEESLHNLWDITNAMNDAESKGFGKGKEEGLHEGLQQGRAEGEKIGIEKGARQNALENAKRMKAEGLDILLIAKITKLPIDDIEKL